MGPLPQRDWHVPDFTHIDGCERAFNLERVLDAPSAKHPGERQTSTTAEFCGNDDVVEAANSSKAIMFRVDVLYVVHKNLMNFFIIISKSFDQQIKTPSSRSLKNRYTTDLFSLSSNFVNTKGSPPTIHRIIQRTKHQLILSEKRLIKRLIQTSDDNDNDNDRNG